MERFGEAPGQKKPEMDSVDREAHEMFMKDAVDSLQEALHIDRAQAELQKQIAAGVLRPDMNLEEAMDALNKRKVELVGEIDEKEDGEDEEK